MITRAYDFANWKESFGKYLESEGKKPSVVKDYPGRIERIRKEEKITIQALAVEIEHWIEEYETGKYANVNKKRHSAPSSALKKFKAFLDYVGFTYSPKTKKASSTTGTEKTAAGAPVPGVFAHDPLVQYVKAAPPAERDETLRRALEEKYPEILQYAAKILCPYANGLLEYIPVYLSNETPPPVDYPVKKSYLDKLKKKAEENGNLTERQWGILDSEKLTTVPLARFFSGKEPYIEIYYRYLPIGTNRIAGAKNCLAHEYMHFLHYYYAAKHGVADPFKKKELSEAIADCFGVLYSDQTGCAEDRLVAKDTYRTWEELLGSGWPYANAIYCFPTPRKKNLSDYDAVGIAKTENKLNTVFGLTKDAKVGFKALKS